MLESAFRPSCMNRASVLEWHNRFKVGRESVRDDERYGWGKEVNTPELIGERLGCVCVCVCVLTRSATRTGSPGILTG